MTEESKLNPYEYVYRENEKVEIEGNLLSELIRFVNNIIDENTQMYYGDRHKHINSETQKEVKKFKNEDLESGKVVKIVDIESTLASAPKPYRNRVAMEAIHKNLILQNIHMKAIRDKKAVHYSELESKETPQSNLILEP